MQQNLNPTQYTKQTKIELLSFKHTLFRNLATSFCQRTGYFRTWL